MIAAGSQAAANGDQMKRPQNQRKTKSALENMEHAVLDSQIVASNNKLMNKLLQILQLRHKPKGC